MSATVAADGLHGAARIRAMSAVALSVLLSVLDYTIVNVALPEIAHAINCSDADSIWVVNAYQLASLIGLLPLAAVGERIGHASMCRIGLVLFLIASLLCAISNNLAELSVARILQGFGGACILSVNTALVRYIFPAAMLGRGIALNGLIVALGVALGPTVAAIVLSVASWRWLFLINLPLGGLALAFALTSLPATPRHGSKFDILSALLLALAFGGLIIGGDRMAHASPLGFSLLILLFGAVALWALIERQKGRADPLLPLDLLARRKFRAAFLTSFTAFVASNFFIISMPFLLMNHMHRSAVTTGLLITPWPLAIVLSAPLVGRLSDKFSAATLSTIGLLITATGFLLLRLLPYDASDFDIAWRIYLAGTGFGLFQPPNNKAMITTAPASRTGSASGMVSVSRLSGQTVGAMLVALALGLAGPAGNHLCLALAAATALLSASLSGSRLKPSKVFGGALLSKRARKRQD